MKTNYSTQIGVVKITVSSHSCSLQHSTTWYLYSNQLMLQNLTCYHCNEDLVNRKSELRLQRNSKNTSAISFFIQICSLVSNAFLPSQASTYHGNQEVDNQCDDYSKNDIQLHILPEHGTCQVATGFTKCYRIGTKIFSFIHQ